MRLRFNKSMDLKITITNYVFTPLRLHSFPFDTRPNKEE